MDKHQVQKVVEITKEANEYKILYMVAFNFQ